MFQSIPLVHLSLNLCLLYVLNFHVSECRKNLSLSDTHTLVSMEKQTH